MNALRRVVPCLLVLSVAAVHAEDTPGWRNDGSGRFPNAKPPVKFSAEDGVVWRAKLPGKSHAAPVLVGDRLFVTADPAHLLAIDAEGGDVLWQRELTYENLFDADRLAEIEEANERGRKLEERAKALRREMSDLRRAGNLTKERKAEFDKQVEAVREELRQRAPLPPPKKGGSGNSAGTPTSDGSRVYCLFATGIVTAHTLDGERLWVASVGPAVDGFGHSASPLLIDGKLVVHTGALTALDPSTGKTLWQTDLPKRWGSPIATKVGDETVIVHPSGSIVRTSNGLVLAEKLFNLGHAAPIVEKDVVYAIAKENVALQLVPRTGGGAIDGAIVWTSKGPRSRSFSSPLVSDGLIYNVDERGVLEVYSAADGSLVYRERLPFDGGRVYSSVTRAGDLLFTGNDRGQVLVFRPGRTFEQVALNDVEGFSAAPVFAGERLYLRGYEHLYAIGK